MNTLDSIKTMQAQLDRLISNYLGADVTIAQAMLPLQIELAGEVPFLLAELDKMNADRDSLASALHESEIRLADCEDERARLARANATLLEFYAEYLMRTAGQKLEGPPGV